MQTDCRQQNPMCGNSVRLLTLCWVFLRIASTSFGGFMALVSVVQNVVVERRKLLTNEDVLNGLSLASVLPGPTAINVVAYVGYRLRGIPGAIVCVVAAVLPSFLLMLLFGYAYLRWGQMPAVGKAFMGVVPAVAAIVAAAAWRMCRTSLKTGREGVLAFSATVLVLGFPSLFTSLAVMVLAAVAGYLWFSVHGREATNDQSSRRASLANVGRPILYANTSLLFFASLPVIAAPLPDFDPGMLLKLFWTFAGMGMMMFGGGYVFIPLLQQVVVDAHGWVTPQEFVDALALGQVTPGPVMISATFIGYKVAGLPGAVAATAGMFGPPAVLMVACTRLFTSAGISNHVQAALRGVRAATTGMIFAAVVTIGKSAAPHWISLVLFIGSLIPLMRYRIEAVWIVPAAAAAGLFFY